MAKEVFNVVIVNHRFVLFFIFYIGSGTGIILKVTV